MFKNGAQHDPESSRMLTEPERVHTKKVYFIKKAKEGQELTTLLKNKFKSIDAIRDILAWFESRKTFHVMLTDWAPEFDDTPPAVVAIGPSLPQTENFRNITCVIHRIIGWLDAGRDFDITLNPTDPFLVNLN
jgi:hypothetical protein